MKRLLLILAALILAPMAYADVGGGFRIVNFPDSYSCSVTNFPTAYPVSGSLSIANFPATQPVSGTFWQATQPISGSVSVSNLPATQPVSGSLSVSNFPVTQPVSGTFWQNTQPVSGSLSVSNFPASQAVTGTFWQATQPVSGTFWQATQPVSLASMPSTPVTGTFWQATQPVSGSMSVSNFPATQPVSIASMPSTPVTGTFFQATQPISGTVSDTPPTLTKGTQGATGFSTQDLKDAGRQYVVLVATGVAGVTTEALFSFQQSKQGVITQGVGSYTVASGKTLRITGLYCSNRSGTTAVAWTKAAIRHNPLGATTATSGLVFGLEASGNAALAGSAGSFSAPFPDGIEITGNGTQSIAVSHLDQATTNLVSCTLTGFEY